MDFALFFVIIILILMAVIFFKMTGHLIFDWGALIGAPFVPTSPEKVKKMLELADPKPGDVIYDLGSGDGRIVIEAAKNYDVKAIGVEANPLLVYSSRRRIKKLGLEKKAEIRWKNIFWEDFSDADIIFVYLLQVTNNLLEKKILARTRPGTKIVSSGFTFKNIPFVKSDSTYERVRLYRTPLKY